MSDASYLPPPIEPVQQTTLDPIRPSPAGYWVAGGVIVVSLLVAGFLFFRGIFGFIGQIDDFERIDPPGRETVTLDAGEWIVYWEGNSGFFSEAPLVTVEQVETGTEIPVTSQGANYTYSDGTRNGQSIGRFDAPSDGRYEISVGMTSAEIDAFGGDELVDEFTDDFEDALGQPTLTSGQIAIGRPLFDGLVPWLLASVGVGGVGLILGVVLLVVTIVRRGRAKRARVAQIPVPPPSAYQPPNIYQPYGAAGRYPQAGGPPPPPLYPPPVQPPPPAQPPPPTAPAPAPPPDTGPWPPAGPSPIS